MRRMVLWGLLSATLLIGGLWLVGYVRPLKMDWESADRRPLQLRHPDDKSAWAMIRTERGRIVLDYRNEEGAPGRTTRYGWMGDLDGDESEDSGDSVNAGWPQIPKNIDVSLSKYGIMLFIESRTDLKSFHLSFPGWYPLMVTGIYPLIVFAMWPFRRWRRRRAGLCRQCGYDLHGNTTGVCSECGASVQMLASRVG